jgi:hypothetical protein
MYLFDLVGWLHVYWVCAAALAVACGIWALFSPPRWVGVVAIAISLFAIFEPIIILWARLRS